jgi:hypothetical protein
VRAKKVTSLVSLIVAFATLIRARHVDAAIEHVEADTTLILIDLQGSKGMAAPSWRRCRTRAATA